MTNTVELAGETMESPQATFQNTGASRVAGRHRQATSAEVESEGSRDFPAWYFWASTIGMVALAAAISLSPRFPIVELSHDRWVELRIEDFLIPLLYVVWGLKVLIHGRNRDARRLRDNPLFWPILAYSAVMVLVTAHGLYRGWVEPARAGLYVLKELEFFALFFFVAHHVRTLGQAKALLSTILAVAAIVASWAVYQGKTGFYYTDAGYRAVMPWDPGVFALGGYCLVLLPIVVALFLARDMGRIRPALLLLAVGLGQALIFSVSRASIFGAAAALALLGALRAKILLAVLVALALFLPLISNNWVETRITSAFKGLDRGVVDDSSMGARVYGMWPAWIKMAGDSNFLGQGKSAVAFGEIPGEGTGFAVVADNFYVRTIGELGVGGLAAFIWLIVILALSLRRAFGGPDSLSRNLALGCIISLFGLLVASFATDAFVVVRVIQPFWFLVGLVLGMHSIRTSSPRPYEEGKNA